ncbi:TPA: hypothetical protein ACPYXD_005285 [Enterobacter hormaechei subsp. xiangfangensis]
MFTKGANVIGTWCVGGRVKLNREVRVAGGTFSEDHEFTIVKVYCGEGNGDFYCLKDDDGLQLDQVDELMLRPADVPDFGLRKLWYKLTSRMAILSYTV